MRTQLNRLGAAILSAALLLIDTLARVLTSAELPLSILTRLIGYVPQSHVPAYDYAVRDFVVMGRAPHLGTFQQPGPKDSELVDQVLVEMKREMADRLMKAKAEDVYQAGLL